MIVFKLILATIVGYVLGIERKAHEKPSGGPRTLALVCLSGCIVAVLTSLIANNINPETHNFSRLISYSLAGIGFLGSGVIIQNKDNVDGLTTAASLFLMVPLGALIGLGFFVPAIVVALLVFIVLQSKYWIINFKKRRK